MALNIVVISPSWPAGTAITLAALRRAISVSISGSVATGDLAAGAVTPAKTSPGAYWYVSATLSSDTYVATFDPALSALANGVTLSFRADAVCPASPKLNPNGLGADKIYHAFNVELAAGDIRAGQIVDVRWESTLDSNGGGWQIVSLGNTPHRYAAAGGTANALTATFAPTVTALAAIAGKPIYVKAASENTGAATLAVDGIAAADIVRRSGVALAAGDILANQILHLVYDSAIGDFVLQNPSRPETPPAIVASAGNLAVVNTGSTTITATADDIILGHTDGRQYRAAAVSLSVNGATTGANGLDTGSLAAGWYYLYAIYNPSTSTVAGLLSLSASSPIMPSGYTYKALISAAYAQTGSTIRPYVQYGRRVAQEEAAIFTGATGVTSFTVLGGADLTAFGVAVPLTIAKCVYLSGGHTDAGNNRSMAVCSHSIAASNIGQAYLVLAARGSALDGLSGGGSASIPIYSGNIRWKAADTAAATYNLTATGFEL